MSKIRDMSQWSKAEKLIFEASQEIETMGADVKLTEAVTKLSEAREKVEQFVLDLEKEIE